MKQHLSPEEFKQLSEYKLKGAPLLAVLDHLEECEECRRKTTSPTKAELLENLFGDDNGSEERRMKNGDIV